MSRKHCVTITYNLRGKMKEMKWNIWMNKDIKDKFNMRNLGLLLMRMTYCCLSIFNHTHIFYFTIITWINPNRSHVLVDVGADETARGVEVMRQSRAERSGGCSCVCCCFISSSSLWKLEHSSASFTVSLSTSLQSCDHLLALIITERWCHRANLMF